MHREKYKVNIPREKVLTRDYWELLQVDPENRVEYTNKFFYKDIILTTGSKMKQFGKMLKLKRLGWKLYETVDLGMKYNTVICRMVKVINYSTEIVLGRGSSIFERSLYDFISNTNHSSRTAFDIAAGIRPKVDHKEDFYTDELSVKHDDFDNVQEQNEVDRDDMKLVDIMLRVIDKRVRDRVKGKKVYDEWDLLGKERCSIGAHSFTAKHCTQAVYRDGLCCYHWMQTQDKRSGCNPAISDESLHTIKKPYIPSVDIKAIEAKMKQYYEASKPITPAAETPKKPRCKHLLHKDECSICLGRPSVKSDSIDGLPEEVDSFMIFHYQ